MKVNKGKYVSWPHSHVIRSNVLSSVSVAHREVMDRDDSPESFSIKQQVRELHYFLIQCNIDKVQLPLDVTITDVGEIIASQTNKLNLKNPSKAKWRRRPGRMRGAIIPTWN